jgi:hypothetical protein
MEMNGHLHIPAALPTRKRRGRFGDYTQFKTVTATKFNKNILGIGPRNVGLLVIQRSDEAACPRIFYWSIISLTTARNRTTKFSCPSTRSQITTPTRRPSLLLVSPRIRSTHHANPVLLNSISKNHISRRKFPSQSIVLCNGNMR